MATATRSEIFEKVQGTLIDALGVDDDEVTDQATLQGDLGAESIDFLDIVFRLEKSFGIKIPRGDLFPEDVLSNQDYFAGGKVTEQGMTELKSRMPWADVESIRESANIQDLFTVGMIVSYVETKLGSNGSN
jgi:acyl carrier protein